MIKTLRPRLPRLGIVRLGEKRLSKSGKEVPVNSQYFVFPKLGELGHELLAGHFDAQTNVLDVHFPIDDIDEVCRDYYRLYTAQGLQCLGDGETGTFLFQEERLDARREPFIHHERRERSCAAKGCPQASAGACRPSALLSFCLSDVPALGVWQMPTRSLAAIRSFRSILGLAREMFGTIVGIPFQLYRYPIQVAPDGHRKQVMAVGLRIHPRALLPDQRRGGQEG
jgi:hypothetical protein